MFRKYLLRIWVISQHLWMILAVLDMEASMTSSWKDGDWSTRIQKKEELIVENISGCICRVRTNKMLICYGSRTCTNFPRNVQVNTWIDQLHLKTTVITNLTKNDFINIIHVRSIEIEANYRLRYLEPGLFHGMTNLEDLSISFNPELKELDPDLFVGLSNLKTVKLTKNGFLYLPDIIPALSPTNVPNLESLSLSQNHFKKIEEEDFEEMVNSNVTELNLYACQVDDIDPQALNVFIKLQNLRIGGNYLTEGKLVALFRNFDTEDIPISFLSLHKASLNKPDAMSMVLDTISMLGVSQLILSKNQIETVGTGLFPYMPNLETLDLRETSIVEIEVGAFNELLFPNLKVLNLGKNRIPGVFPGVLPTQLLELDLSENSGHDRFSSYFDVASGENFENMTHLVSLNLSFNRIVTITNTSFLNVTGLKILGLKNSTIFFIANNSFSMLRHLELLNLEDNSFPPFNLLEGTLFTGLTQLEMLLLSNCNIKSIRNPSIFKPLISLKYLNMANNLIMRINPVLLRPLKTLVGLDLSHNHLEPWRTPNRIFRQNSNLEVFLVSYNKFTYISQAMLDDFESLKHLDLAQNPFICDCAYFNSTRFWLQKKNRTVGDTKLMSSNIICVSPDFWRNKNIAEFMISNSCSTLTLQSKILLYFLAPFALFCTVVVLTSLVVYKYRWHIRYWIFLLRLNLVRNVSHNMTEMLSKDFKYDAFVSYSSADRNFVVRLVAMLENYEPFLKLCVYERDFEVGTIITETVLESVEASRKMLLVVSDSFAKSQWCSWETHLAENHTVFFNKEQEDASLVIIKLGPIAKSHITPTLKYLLKTRIYLEWDPNPEKQKVFWNKLRFTLSRRKFVNT